MTEIGARIMPYPTPQEHPAAKEGWPTVTHEPGLSTAYENRGTIFRRIPHALSCTTTHENKTALRHAGATTSLHSRRGYAGAPCPK
jgi:hypothetical protein